MYKRIVAEYNIKPWEMHKLTTHDLQVIGLAEHTEAYKQQQLQEQRDTGYSGGQRSKTDTKSYNEWKQRMAN